LWILYCEVIMCWYSEGTTGCRSFVPPFFHQNTSTP